MRLKQLFVGGALVAAMIGSGQAQSPERVALVSGRPGGMCVYELRFVASDTLLPDAAFELVLPQAFDVSRVQLASSNALKGGLSVQVARDTVRIFRSGLGPAVAPGTLVDILLAAVQPRKEAPVSTQATLQVLPRRGVGVQSLLLPVTSDTTGLAR